MTDPTIPLNPADDDAGGSLHELPVSEPLQAPVAPDEQGADRPQEAAGAAVTPIAAAPSQNGQGGLHDVREALSAPAKPRRVIGDVTHLATMQHDLEQLHAEATSTRRAVQLLAVSIGAVAALVMVYTLRARIAGAGAGAGAGSGSVAS